MTARRARLRTILALVVVFVALATGITACSSEAADDEAVANVVEDYLRAVGDGDGAAACALLTPDAQLGIFEFRLVHARADHPDQACARIVERNRLKGEKALDSAEISEVEIDRASATAIAGGAEVELERVGEEWKIARFGVAEAVVPGERQPPEPASTTLSS